MKPQLNPLSSRLDSRLAAYAAVASAALAAPALPSAEAAIVSSGPINITIPSTSGGVYLNLVTGIFAATPGAAVGWDVNPYGTTVLNMFGTSGAGGNVLALGGLAPYVGSGTNWFNLAAGTLISGASTWGGTGINTISALNPLSLNSSNNFVGFRFFNESTSAVNFGWMQISLAGTAGGQPRAIVAYAYENTGAGIAAGAVPEPSTYALFSVVAAGALGLRAWRRRKAA